MKDQSRSPASTPLAHSVKPIGHGAANVFADFVPGNPGADPLNISMNFNGSMEEAANYYYKEANKLYFANLVLNNQVISERLSLRPSWRKRIS